MRSKLEPLTLINWRGFFLGWHWVHQSGDTSRSSACIAAYHNPKSITWRWSVYWSCRPTPFRIWKHLRWIGIWRLDIRWQDNLFR